ncbi:MAG: CoA-binding protein [Candidatus Wallbacteria bacterium]
MNILKNYNDDLTRFDALINEFLAPRSFALIGASNNPDKYGNIILKNMVSKGYGVYPVNPNEQKINGIKCHNSISELPDFIKFVNIVLPPVKSLNIMDECASRGIKIVWFQPGAYDETVIKKCEQLSIKHIYGPCIMVCSNF